MVVEPSMLVELYVFLSSLRWFVLRLIFHFTTKANFGKNILNLMPIVIVVLVVSFTVSRGAITVEIIK